MTRGAYLVVSILLILGFFDPTPSQLFTPTVGLTEDTQGSVSFANVSYAITYYILHFLPLLYTINVYFRLPSRHESFWWRTAFRPATAIAVFTLPATALVDLFSGPAAGWGTLHHVALTFILVGCSRWISSDLKSAEIGSAKRIWLTIPAALGGIAALYSLSVLAASAAGARLIAGQAPYCIAAADSLERVDYAPVKSWQELRGSELATTKTGYKSTSHWFFHAVLIRKDDTATRYFNWSYSRMRWERYSRYPLDVVSIVGACEPVENFLSTLTLIRT